MMATKVRGATRKAGGTATKKRTRRTATAETVHNHHWLLESPNGPLSIGTCSSCGETREFRNSSEDSIWDRSEGRSRWNDMGITNRRRRTGEDAN